MGFLSATLEVARQTLRLLLPNRLLWLVLAAEVGIALIAFLLGARTDLSGRHLYCIFSWWMLTTVLLPWTTMYFGVQAVHGDIEDMTFQYLFLRPVPRAAVLLGKWLAAAALCAAVITAGTVLVYLVLLLHDHLWPDGPEPKLLAVFAPAVAMGAVAYAAVAALFAARFRRPLVWSAFFIVGLELFVANLPKEASIRSLTIADPVRRFVLDGIEPDRRLARTMWPSEMHFDPEAVGEPVLNLAILAGVVLLLALWSYSRTEYDSRQRE